MWPALTQTVLNLILKSFLYSVLPKACLFLFIQMPEEISHLMMSLVNKLLPKGKEEEEIKKTLRDILMSESIFP